jgi:hypothetical protein
LNHARGQTRSTGAQVAWGPSSGANSSPTQQHGNARRDYFGVEPHWETPVARGIAGKSGTRSPVLDLVPHFYGRQIVPFEARSIRRNPKTGRVFQEHGGVTARRHHPPGRGVLFDFIAYQQLLAGRTFEPVVAVGQKWSSTVSVAEARRIRKRFDITGALLAIVAIANQADYRRADSLTSNTPAGARRISGEHRGSRRHSR